MHRLCVSPDVDLGMLGTGGGGSTQVLWVYRFVESALPKANKWDQAW